MILGWKIGVWGAFFVVGLSAASVLGEDRALEESAPAEGIVATSLAKEMGERHLIRVAQLRTHYLQALLRLEERLTKERRIDDALRVRAEVERFRRGNLVPDPKLNRLAKLRELGMIYSNEVKKITGEFEIEMAAFRKRRGEAFASKRAVRSGDSG